MSPMQQLFLATNGVGLWPSCATFHACAALCIDTATPSEYQDRLSSTFSLQQVLRSVLRFQNEVLVFPGVQPIEGHIPRGVILQRLSLIASRPRRLCFTRTWAQAQWKGQTSKLSLYPHSLSSSPPKPSHQRVPSKQKQNPSFTSSPPSPHHP